MRSGFILLRLVTPVVLLAAASCALAPPAATAVAPAAAGAATILAVRPIVPLGADGGGWRAALLNGAPGPADAAQPAAAAEFIIHDDAGAILSIVQSNAAGLHPGDRVTITRATGRPGVTRLL